MPRTTNRGAVPSVRQGFRPDIQGLRALAVGIVMLDHAGFTTFSGGYVGVDVFFVISGFLITSLLMREAERDRRISLAGFYSRRARRILPAATLVLVATCPRVAAVAAPRAGLECSRTPSGPRCSSPTSASRRRHRLLRAGPRASPLQHYWSLSVEEQFYLVWPVLMLGRRLALASHGRISWAVTGPSCCSAASLAWSVHATTEPDPPTSPRCPRLGVGRRSRDRRLLSRLVPLAALGGSRSGGSASRDVGHAPDFSAPTPFPG